MSHLLQRLLNHLDNSKLFLGHKRLVFDQSEHAQGPIYIINAIENKGLSMKGNWYVLKLNFFMQKNIEGEQN